MVLMTVLQPSNKFLNFFHVCSASVWRSIIYLTQTKYGIILRKQQCLYLDITEVTEHLIVSLKSYMTYLWIHFTHFCTGNFPFV